MDEWGLGSLCSGSDAPVLTCKAFVAAMAELIGGKTARLQHLYSCEQSHRKREFLKDLFRDSMMSLYDDVLAMGEKDKCKDHIHGRLLRLWDRWDRA